MGTRANVEDEARRTYLWEVHPETATEILSRKAAAVALGAAARTHGLDGFLSLAEAGAAHEIRATSGLTKGQIYVVRSDGWALGLEQTGDREVFLCGAVRAIMNASASAMLPPDCAACGGEGTVQDDPEPGVHGPAVDCRDCGGAGVVEAASSCAWGTSPDEIKGREDDREAAIEAAREEAEDGATVYVWSTLRDIDPAAYLPSAEDLIEDMGERAYHDQPEWIQDDPWPDVDADATAELAKLLEPIEAWARKHARSWWIAYGEPEAVPPEGRLGPPHARESVIPCPCGGDGCTGPADNERHQCGGPSEACGVTGCAECRGRP